MGHIVIPRNVFTRMARSNLWVQYKKHPQYWFMVSVSMIAAPSFAISTSVRKLNSYEYLYGKANQKLMKDTSKYEKYLSHS